MKHNSGNYEEKNHSVIRSPPIKLSEIDLPSTSSSSSHRLSHHFTQSNEPTTTSGSNTSSDSNSSLASTIGIDSDSASYISNTSNKDSASRCSSSIKSEYDDVEDTDENHLCGFGRYAFIYKTFIIT